DPKPEPRNPNPETRNPKPETRNPKPETRNPKPETRNPNPKPRTPNPETRNPKPETRNPCRAIWFWRETPSTSDDAEVIKLHALPGLRVDTLVSHSRGLVIVLGPHCSYPLKKSREGLLPHGGFRGFRRAWIPGEYLTKLHQEISQVNCIEAS
ncbi:hypothetical protein T484DRAFT_1611429, partial [Baffinella frigidus]